MPVLLLVPLLLAGSPAPSGPCTARGTSVVVRTTEHRLYACQDGGPVHDFGVRLGRKGTGKTRQGDGKTPLGTYSLGSPRASRSYGLFVPIGYPTAGQRRQGYTGSAVGIHGPLRSVRWLKGAVNWFDTSDGCVGLATDDEMKVLAAWLRARRPARVILE